MLLSARGTIRGATYHERAAVGGAAIGLAMGTPMVVFAVLNWRGAMRAQEDVKQIRKMLKVQRERDAKRERER